MVVWRCPGYQLGLLHGLVYVCILDYVVICTSAFFLLCMVLFVYTRSVVSAFYCLVRLVHPFQSLPLCWAIHLLVFLLIGSFWCIASSVFSSGDAAA